MLADDNYLLWSTTLEQNQTPGQHELETEVKRRLREVFFHLGTAMEKEACTMRSTTHDRIFRARRNGKAFDGVHRNWDTRWRSFKIGPFHSFMQTTSQIRRLFRHFTGQQEHTESEPWGDYRTQADTKNRIPPQKQWQTVRMREILGYRIVQSIIWFSSFIPAEGFAFA
jgi:hypothetical protein